MMENVVGDEVVGGDIAGDDPVASTAASVAETSMHVIFNDGDMAAEICPNVAPSGIDGFTSPHPIILRVFQSNDVVGIWIQIFQSEVFDSSLLDGIDDENAWVEPFL